MSDKRDLGENWDRSQWPSDGTAPDAPESETWSREQMEIDDEDEDAAASRVREEVPPPAAGDSGLTGGGQPGSESHWERVDED